MRLPRDAYAKLDIPERDDVHEITRDIEPLNLVEKMRPEYILQSMEKFTPQQILDACTEYYQQKKGMLEYFTHAVTHGGTVGYYQYSPPFTCDKVYGYVNDPDEYSMFHNIKRKYFVLFPKTRSLIRCFLIQMTVIQKFFMNFTIVLLIMVFCYGNLIGLMK